VHLAREGQSLGIRFSAVISYGNAADLNEADFLRYFARDPQTSIIAGYLEGSSDGRDFADALREASAVKPVLLWKVGKHDSSRRAVATHTGSLAGASRIWEAVLRQAGAIEVSGIDEMLDVLVALKTLGPNPVKRLLISGGGGGIGTYGADLAEAEGLQVPPPADDSLAKMQSALSRMGAVAGNPLDIGMPLIPLQEFEGAMREAALNPTTEVLIFDLAVNFALPIVSEDGLQKACEILIKAHRESGKPLAVVLYSRACDPGNLTLEGMLREMRQMLLDNGVAVFSSMPRAIKAIARVNSLRA
jgi:acyl-CoA synthetase (NDP forming)